MVVRFWKWRGIFCETVKIFCSIIENWNFQRKLCNFRGCDYRTFAENLLAKSQNTRKPRSVCRTQFLNWCNHFKLKYVWPSPLFQKTVYHNGHRFCQINGEPFKDMSWDISRNIEIFVSNPSRTSFTSFLLLFLLLLMILMLLSLLLFFIRKPSFITWSELGQWKLRYCWRCCCCCCDCCWYCCFWSQKPTFKVW